MLITPPAGPQQFSKIGTRNAMVISVAAFGLALHPDRGEVRTGIGSAAPTPRRAPEAEAFLGAALAAEGLWESRGELPRAAGRGVRRAGRGRGLADRRRAGHRGVPPALSRRDGPPRP